MRASHQSSPGMLLATSVNVVPPEPRTERVELFCRRRVLLQSRELDDRTDGGSDLDGKLEVPDAEAIEPGVGVDVVLVLEKVGKGAKVGEASFPPVAVTVRESAEEVRAWLLEEGAVVVVDLGVVGILVRRSEDHLRRLVANSLSMLLEVLEELVETVDPRALRERRVLGVPEGANGGEEDEVAEEREEDLIGLGEGVEELAVDGLETILATTGVVGALVCSSLRLDPREELDETQLDVLPDCAKWKNERRLKQERASLTFNRERLRLVDDGARSPGSGAEAVRYTSVVSSGTRNGTEDALGIAPSQLLDLLLNPGCKGRSVTEQKRTEEKSRTPLAGRG